MGMHDASYHLSWHIYQSCCAIIGSFLITVFGLIFNFDLFTKNDFMVIFFTFWFFQQAMIGYANAIGACLKESSQAVTVGFLVFFMCFILYFVILFGFPFGTFQQELPFSYIQEGFISVRKPESSSDHNWLWIFAIISPSNLFVMSISHLGALTATDKDFGLRFGDANTYCEVSTQLGITYYCDPSYDINSAWGIWILEYICFSILALYLDAILPDAMGMKKVPW